MIAATKLHKAIVAYVHYYVGMSNCNPASKPPVAMITYEHDRFPRRKLWFLCIINCPPRSPIEITAEIPYVIRDAGDTHNLHGYNFSTHNMLPLCYVYGFDSTIVPYKWDYEDDTFKCP